MSLFIARFAWSPVFALAALGLSLSAGAALAQDEVVVVHAPRAYAEPTDKTVQGQDVLNLSVSYQVSYSDLDLRRKADQLELQRRIVEMANRGCRELNEAYPEPGFMPLRSQNCVFDAVRDADGQVTDNFIAAAYR
jgi:UrcA family protein